MVAGNIFLQLHARHAPTCQDAFASGIFGEVSDSQSLLKLSLEFSTPHTEVSASKGGPKTGPRHSPNIAELFLR